MPVGQLAHYSIRTDDLAAAREFYTEVMGFRVGYRPAFPFPGLWLYEGEDESGYGVVHIIGRDEPGGSGLTDYLGARSEGSGTGALDHMAFHARNWADMRERLRQLNIDYAERTVPALGLHQVFLVDPSGVVIELNYPATEGG